MAKPNPFGDFDFTKMMDPSKLMGDFPKLMGDFKVPGVDVEAVVASQRRKPTLSPRKRIDNAVTKSGETKPVAEASAIGRNRKPEMKNSDDERSATPRSN